MSEQRQDYVKKAVLEEFGDHGPGGSIPVRALLLRLSTRKITGSELETAIQVLVSGGLVTHRSGGPANLGSLVLTVHGYEKCIGMQRGPKGTGESPTTLFMQKASMRKGWDVFVSHASEDKEDFVRPLVNMLRERGLQVWFDEFTLRVGDSLRRSIDHGLASSTYGIVVISHAFLAKEWPQKELDGLVALEIDSRKVILPVWHNIGVQEVRQYSPTLADRLATNSAKGLHQVVADLLAAIRPSDNTSSSASMSASPQIDSISTSAWNAVQQSLEKGRNIVWTIQALGRRINDPRPVGRSYRESAECRLEEINEHYVRAYILSTGQTISIPLRDIVISFDDSRNRPMIQLRA